MSPLLLNLTTLAALGCAVLAGVFIAFSTLVMKALGRVPAPQGILAMQEINRAALTPAFMVLFLGTTLLCGMLSVWSFLLWGSGSALLLLAAGVTCLVGAFGLTAAITSRGTTHWTPSTRPGPTRSRGGPATGGAGPGGTMCAGVHHWRRPYCSRWHLSCGERRDCPAGRERTN